MKKIKFLLVAFVALCLTTNVEAQNTKSKAKTKQTASAKAYQCTMKCEGEKTYAKAGKCPECNMNLKEVKKTDTAYQCPMKCEGEKTYAQAGKCPVCNMNLKATQKKEKKKDDHAGHNHS